MKYDKRISLVIPALDEAENLPSILKQIPEYVDEIIIVDGYSEDKTVEIAKEYGCKVYFDNVGKGSALIKGVKNSTGEYIVMMDADLSHRLQEFNLFLEKLESGYDICMGSRFIQGGGTDDITILRRMGNKFFVWAVNILFDASYSDICYGYRSFKKEAFEKLNLKSKGFSIEIEMSIKTIKNNLKAIEIPSFEKKRKYGKGKLKPFPDGWKIMGTILTEIFNKGL